MQGAARLQLRYPYVEHAEAAPLQPLPDVLDERGNVARLETLDVAVGEGEHGATCSETVPRLLEQLGSGEH